MQDIEGPICHRKRSHPAHCKHDNSGIKAGHGRANPLPSDGAPYARHLFSPQNMAVEPAVSGAAITPQATLSHSASMVKVPDARLPGSRMGIDFGDVQG